MGRMNILLLTPTYYPTRGGTEQVIHDVTQEFVSKGHDVTILTVCKHKDWSQFETIDTIPVHRISFSEVFPTYPRKNIKIFFKTLALLRSNTFDIVVQYHVYPLGLGAILAAKLTRTKFITSLSGWDTYDPVFKIKPFYVRIMKWVMNRSDACTSPSTQMAEIAQKVQGCNKEFTIIPHGTRLTCSEKAYEGPIYKRLKSLQKKLIVSIQRLHERKGLTYLLSAIPSIVERIPDAYFIIGGKGPEEESLKKQCRDLNIEEYVSFEGFIDDEDLGQYHAAADVFALPTLYEAFGLVYIDALTYGTPIVTCDNAGARDIIRDFNGLVTPIKDSMAFASATIEALQKEWDSEAIQKDAQRYRWPIIADKYVEVYQSTIDSRK